MKKAITVRIVPIIKANQADTVPYSIVEWQPVQIRTP